MLAMAASMAVMVGGSALAGDFQPLFNGKDFSGWVEPKDKTIWSVEDGEIVGRTKEGQLEKNEFLVTDRPYKNFVLRVKIKLRNHNSGIQFHSKRADDGAVAGPQVDAADGYWGVLYDERGKRGIIERYDPEKAKTLAKKGDWNEFEISVKDNHLTVVLNGTKIIDRQDDQFPENGVIALQVHKGPPMEVRFKDLEIKMMD
jgi:hypothetical protein